MQIEINKNSTAHNIVQVAGWFSQQELVFAQDDPKFDYEAIK